MRFKPWGGFRCSTEAELNHEEHEEHEENYREFSLRALRVLRGSPFFGNLPSHGRVSISQMGGLTCARSSSASFWSRVRRISPRPNPRSSRNICTPANW